MSHFILNNWIIVTPFYQEENDVCRTKTDKISDN